MNINVFRLEEYLGKYEFSAPYLLCCSDVETVQMREIVEMAPDRKIWDELSLGYTEVKGLPILRKQIANSLYQSEYNDAQLSPDNILCFAGAEDAILCALHTLIEPGDHVIVLTPAYQSLVEIPRLKGASISEIQLREENQWKIDLDEIKSAIQKNTKCIVINFPHNPTGQIIAEEELCGLVEICEAHDTWLFADEVYRLLGQTTKWASNAAQIYLKAMSLGVMSKSFGMPGLRVGWIACQDTEMLRRIEFMKHYTSICNSAPSEVLALITLQNIDAILARSNEIVSENLIILRKFMSDYAHLFEWIEPQGACTGFIKYKSTEKVDIFCDRLVEDKGVLLLPASVYGDYGNYFRIGFGRKNMPEALARVVDFLESEKV